MRFPRNKKFRMLMALPVLAVVGFLMAGCGATAPAPSAMGAFVVGDGHSSHDTRVHNFVYPNQKIKYDNNTEVLRYIPLNARNYIVNDGSKRDANGNVVGDVHSPFLVYTKSGTPVQVQASAFWTLNQTRSVLINQFWPLCYKYTCASSDAKGGDVNFSTVGWNGMLGENFLPSMQAAIADAMSEMDDTIWQTHSRALYVVLAKKASEKFADEVLKTTGYNVNLFCGSGDSSWLDKDYKTFRCTNVRFRTDDVKYDSSAVAGTGTANNAVLNKQKLDAARALYGDNAGYWLGLQDTIGECKDSKVACVINVGSGGATAVPVPTAGPVTTTTAGK